MSGLPWRKYRARTFGLRLGARLRRGCSDEWRRLWRQRDGRWRRMLRRWLRLPLNLVCPGFSFPRPCEERMRRGNLTRHG